MNEAPQADELSGTSDTPLGEALHGFINDAVERARDNRRKAQAAQIRAAGVLLPDERALVLRDLPPLPALVMVSPDALFEILNHDGEPLATASTAFNGWVLTGCGLPLVIDSKIRTGHTFRIEDNEARGI